MTKYSLECFNQTVKFIEVNDGHNLLNIDSSVDIYINPKDIMQYNKTK
jgi:hypothetical protein